MPQGAIYESVHADEIYESFKDADPSVVQEAVRIAELYIQQQLTTLTAQGQRAATLAGIFGTTAIFLGTVSLSSSSSGWLPAYGSLAGILGAIGMLIAAFTAAYAANSTEVRYAGNHPVNWISNRSPRHRTLALAGELGNYQTTIEFNGRITRTHGRLLRISLKIGLGVPVVLVVVLIYLAWPSLVSVDEKSPQGIEYHLGPL